MSLKERGAAVLALVVLAAACGSDSGDAISAPAVTTVESSEELAEELAATTVRPGRANWSTGYFQAAVYSALLRELGYTVLGPELNEHPPPEAYFAMAQGAFDFWPNGWYSQHYTWHERELENGSLVGEHLVVLGEQIAAGGLEGLVITRSVAAEHGIESLGQINDDPELTALFDVDGDGLAEVFGCPDDWTCDDIIDEIIEFNGWSNLEQVKAGYPGLVAASIDRVENDEPVIQYTWSPSGYLTRLIPGETVLWLSLGDADNVLDGSTPGGFDFSDSDPAPLGRDCTADPCWLGWEANDIQITANRAFAEDNPVAVALFGAVTLDVADISAQNVRYDNGENSEADVTRHAAEWVAANRALVDEWLDTARAAGG